MAVPKHPVLLDNCAISACEKTGAWNALVTRYTLETVEEVEKEAATGWQHRTIIPPQQFRQQVKVHPVNELERITAQLDHAELAKLDPGERDLWIHALSRSDGWILCGPDIASIKFGVANGFRDRLISLEQLLSQIGCKPKHTLPDHYTAKWLKDEIEKLVLEQSFRNLAAQKTKGGKG